MSVVMLFFSMLESVVCPCLFKVITLLSEDWLLFEPHEVNNIKKHLLSYHIFCYFSWLLETF